MTNKLSAEQTFGLLRALTGIDIEDFMREEAASTPEEKTEQKVETLRKMHAHTHRMHISDVPNWMKYPETGFPPDHPQSRILLDAAKS